MKTIKLQFTDFERQINKSLNEDWTEVRGAGFCDVEHLDIMQAISHAFWVMTTTTFQIGEYTRTRGAWQDYKEIEAFWKGELTVTIGDVTYVKKGKNKFGL